MATEFRTKGGFAPQMIYAVVLPLFFLSFTLLYNPFDIKGYYSFGTFIPGVHLVLLSSIILVCCALTRTCLHFILKHNALLWWQYGLWCLGEMVLTALFFALYTALFKGSEGGFFAVLPQCLKFACLTLAYPYAFLILAGAVRRKDEDLRRKDEPADNTIVRFHDEHKRLKLSIAPSAILYVNSEYNYVKIHYLDAGRVRDFVLRASMKSLESLDCRSLVRCHRSYFVNPEHITVLRKDPQGLIFAQMNIPDVDPVPVSKQYYDSLSALL